MTPRRRALVAALVAVAAVAGWVAYAWRAAPFRDEVAALRARGFATDFATLQADTSPAADDDGAADFEGAFEWLDASVGSEDTWGVTGSWDTNAQDPWDVNATPEQRAALIAALDRAQPFFDRLAAATAKPRLRLRHALDVAGMPGWEPTGPRLMRVQGLLDARARVGDAARRIAACRDLLRFGARRLPVRVIDTPIAAACLRSGARAVRDGVASGALDPARVRAALDPELRFRALDLWGPFARSEIASIVIQYEVVRGDRPWPPGLPKPTFRDRVDSAIRALRGKRHDAADLTPAAVARSLEWWADMASANPRPYAALRARLHADDDSPLELIAPQFADKIAATEAALALARVGLAVAERHERTGAWPTSLDEVRDVFPDGMPTDPFTDAPFTYEVADESVRISSPGRTPDRSPLDDEDLRDSGILWEFPR